MKRTISICLVISSILLLCSCSGSNSSNETTTEQSSVIETTTAIETTTTIPTETTKLEPEFQTFKYGETIYLDFAEIKLDGTGYPLTAGKEVYWAYLAGTIKNLSTTYINPSEFNSYVVVICDDKYTYIGTIDILASSDDGVAPQETADIFITAYIPADIGESFSTVKVRFGFTENFKSSSTSHITDFEECDYIYEFDKNIR